MAACEEGKVMVDTNGVTLKCRDGVWVPILVSAPGPPVGPGVFVEVRDEASLEAALDRDDIREILHDPTKRLLITAEDVEPA